MIVCSCNVLSDDDVRAAVSGAADVPRTARQLYGCLGCSAECGRCARTIKRIMTEALGACARPGIRRRTGPATPSATRRKSIEKMISIVPRPTKENTP